MDLPRNCALFIAQQVVANVRELEGALNKVVAISRFKGTPIDLDVVRESLKDVLAIRARTISTENIQRVVSEYFRIPLKEIVGPKRTRIYARPVSWRWAWPVNSPATVFRKLAWLLGA